MEPYATAAEPGPLNGNRPAISNRVVAFYGRNRTAVIVVGVVGAVLLYQYMTKKKAKKAKKVTKKDEK
tara:strand:+ start:526 stop:729 length:204 start_codon:yes stop_codon:yes gene_type:complete